MTQTSLLQQLRQTDDPREARSLALELLDSSKRREMVDAALRTLENADLDDSARPVLRRKTWHYFDHHREDAGALIREMLLRMLVKIGHPDERDLYLRGLATYEIVPMMGEVTQNLRAVSLVGLAQNEPDLALTHATRLLCELDSTSQFNGEPAVTAINLLSQRGQAHTIYAFLLLGGLDALEAGQNEVVSRALESLGADFPVALFQSLIDIFLPRDRAVVSMGIITHIVDHRVRELYDVVDSIMRDTRHDELHHYGAVVLAASRDDELVNRLYTLAKISPPHRLANFIEAVELVPGEEKNELLAWLRTRQANQ
jgi:hypothetical protein